MPYRERFLLRSECLAVDNGVKERVEAVVVTAGGCDDFFDSSTVRVL